MSRKVAFFTVCGGGEDYEFLLGAIEHHAEMGRHFVLDTTPADRARTFKRLPDSVEWLHEPVYGAGWKEFKSRTAVERAMNLAKTMDADVLVYLDSDDFYTWNSQNDLFPHAQDAMVEVNYTHWLKDGMPYMFGESEWHAKLWPTKGNVEIALNVGWQAHLEYNGNPELHQVPIGHGMPFLRVPGNFRHHMHYAIGAKIDELEIAKTTIAGWPDQGKRVPMVPWPAKLRLWKDKGILPSESFQ
jgi:hypothetical protein